MTESTRPRRRLSAAQRRQAILEAAQEVFAAGGYHGSSIDEIAQAAGISKALIYEHFESKKELHASMLAAGAQELFERFAVNAARGETGRERLRGGVDAFFGFVEERGDVWAAFFRDASDPEIAPLLDRLQHQATGAIAALMENDPAVTPRLGETPEMRARTLEAMAQLLSGAVQSLANWWLEHPEVPRAQLVDHVEEFCWLGMERTRDGARAGD